LSVGKIASDGTLVINDAFAEKIGEVIGSKFNGIQVDRSEVVLLSDLLKKEGYVPEADAIDAMMKGIPENQGVVMMRASDKDIEFTSSHEFTHKRMKEVFGDFATSFKKTVQPIVDTVRNAIDKDTFYKTIDDADLLQEILAHGLTFDSKGLKVKPAVLTRALADIIEKLSTEYSSKKVEEVVNLILKDIDSFDARVELKPSKVTKAKETIQKKYETAKQTNEISESAKMERNAEIQQAIADANEAESFVSVENLQNKGQTGFDKADSRPDEIGLKKVDTETPEFKDWAENAVIKDENGKPKQLFHGTTHDFDTFDTSKISPEGFYGRSIYLTDSALDSSKNYAGVGADLTQRINNLANDLAFEDENPADVDQYIEQATEMLKGTNNGINIPLYAKMKKPVSVSPIGGNSTFFKEGTMATAKLVNAVRTVARKYNFEEEKLEDLNKKIDSYISSGGITAYQFDQILRGSDAFRIYDKDSKLLTAEAIREVFVDAGFDGIILDAKRLFPFMKMDKGTKHYHIFDPTYVKSAIANTGEFSKKNPSFLLKVDTESPEFKKFIGKSEVKEPLSMPQNLTLILSIEIISKLQTLLFMSEH